MDLITLLLKTFSSLPVPTESMQAPGLPSSGDIVPYWEPNIFAPCPPSIKCHLNQKTQHNCDLVFNVFPPLLSWEWIWLIQAKVLGRNGERGEWGCVVVLFPLLRKQGRCLSAVSTALLLSWPLYGGFQSCEGFPPALVSASCCVLLLTAVKSLTKGVTNAPS